jgi:hypothetical protein
MKRQVIAKINEIANELDRNGFYAEANTLTNVMKKLAFDRDFDEEGTSNEYDFLNDDPESDIPVKDGLVMVQYSADEFNKYQSTFTIYVSIKEPVDETDPEGEKESRIVKEINSYRDENGETKILHDREIANRLAKSVAKSMKEEYPDVYFRVQEYNPPKYNRSIPPDFEREEQY